VALLREADVLVHGYRADALEKLGLGADARRRIRPGLVDVCLNAYGWSGPWQYRRGFDSLVQMSAGIADAGMRLCGTGKPTPLPVQALDHATGYLMAAAAVNGLARRLRGGTGSSARLSLARTALLLQSVEAGAPGESMAPAGDADYSTLTEATSFGPAHRLLPPVSVTGAPMRWDLPATSLGSSAPAW
jgi:crotonobetainyl-CoA:carnitine CoA-transferase CaiB-like acyl-CoA transferase